MVRSELRSPDLAPNLSSGVVRITRVWMHPLSTGRIGIPVAILDVFFDPAGRVVEAAVNDPGLLPEKRRRYAAACRYLTDAIARGCSLAALRRFWPLARPTGGIADALWLAERDCAQIARELHGCGAAGASCAAGTAGTQVCVQQGGRL